MRQKPSGRPSSSEHTIKDIKCKRITFHGQCMKWRLPTLIRSHGVLAPTTKLRLGALDE
jgi:hypothetical protein